MGRSTSIKTLTTDNFTQLVDNINNQSIDVGATGRLTTTVDSDIVGAINELDSNMGAKTSLTTTVKTSIVNAINELDSDVGALSNFDADIRDSNFVSTINTLNAKVNAGTSFNAIGLDSVGNDSDTLLGGFNDSSERASLVAALNTLSQDIGKLDSNVNRDDRLTTTASTLFGAINELDAEIGAASLNTSATTLRGAINEHEADIAALDVFQNIATDSGSISIGADSSNDTLTILGAGSLKTTGFANTVQIDHDVAAASSVNNSGNTFIQDLTIDGNGHVTGTASSEAVINDGTLTVSGGTNISGSGTFTANQSGNTTITLNNDITNNNQLTNGAGYITAASLPTVNNGTLTVNATNPITGSGSFTANQSGNSTVTVGIINNPTFAQVYAGFYGNSTAGYLSTSNASYANRAPDVWKEDRISGSAFSQSLTPSSGFTHPTATLIRSGSNGTSHSGNYIYIGSGTHWISAWCTLARVASDTADNCSMWIGKSDNLNGQYIVGSANAIGDWSTSIFKAEGIISTAGYYAIRFYSNETIRYRYANTGYPGHTYCFARIMAWKMY